MELEGRVSCPAYEHHHFVYEVKFSDFLTVERQVIQDLYGAPLQRSALRMLNGAVFGGVVNHAEFFSYVSFWQGGELVSVISPRYR